MKQLVQLSIKATDSGFDYFRNVVQGADNASVYGFES